MIKGVPNEETETSYVEALREKMEAALERARSVLRLSARCQKQYYDRVSMKFQHEVDSSVWCRVDRGKKGVSRKFRENWDGPYRVLDRLSDVTYRVGKVGKKKEKVVHFEKLKKYKGDLPRCWDSIGTPKMIKERKSDEPEGQSSLPESSNSGASDSPTENASGLRKRKPPSWMRDFVTL